MRADAAKVPPFLAPPPSSSVPPPGLTQTLLRVFHTWHTFRVPDHPIINYHGRLAGREFPVVLASPRTRVWKNEKLAVRTNAMASDGFVRFATH